PTPREIWRPSSPRSTPWARLATSPAWRCSRTGFSFNGIWRSGDDFEEGIFFMATLTQLVEDLAAGRLKVVDLTQPLGPDTPVIDIPPMFAASPGVSIEVISRYDQQGPAWYWNTLRFGEHTGTHFDAPIHWVTGRELKHNACDTIPARRFIGPACVIDVT